MLTMNNLLLRPARGADDHGAVVHPQKPLAGAYRGAGHVSNSQMTIVPFPSEGTGTIADVRGTFRHRVHMKPAFLDDECPDAKRPRPIDVAAPDSMQEKGTRCSFASDSLLQPLKESIVEYLTNLATACTSIPGEEDSIDSETDEQMYVAREHIADEMTNIIASEGADDSDLKKLCVDMYQQHALKAIKRHKDHLSACIDGIDMLAIVAASSNRVDDVTKLLVQHYAIVKRVCADPPRALLESMAAHGIGSSVLTVLFNHCGPSVAHAARILCQYLSTTAHRLHGACMDALKVLRARLELPSSSDSWSQIDLVCPGTKNLNFDETCNVLPPPHMSSGRVTTIARSGKSSGALRIPRFVRALQLCVAQVGSAGLWQRIDADYIARCVSRHQAYKQHKGFEGGRYGWCCPSESLVPEELKRDFHILVAMQQQIPTGAGVLDVADVTKLLMAPGAFFFDGSTQRSVEQAVHHVMRKSAHQVCKQNRDGCGIQYIKDEGFKCSIGYLRLDAAGSAMLRIRVREILTCMASSNRKMRAEWRASRSSRSVAAAARRAK